MQARWDAQQAIDIRVGLLLQPAQVGQEDGPSYAMLFMLWG